MFIGIPTPTRTHQGQSPPPGGSLSSSVPTSGSVPARPRLGVKALPRTNPSYRSVGAQLQHNRMLLSLRLKVTGPGDITPKVKPHKSSSEQDLTIELFRDSCHCDYV